MTGVQKKQKNIIIFLIATFTLFLVFNYKVFFGMYFNFLGNREYQNKDFDSSFINHEKALRYNETPEIFYNLGNDIYKIGEKEESKEQKIEKYKQALGMYQQSLTLKEDPITFENYEFVRKKIEELEDKKDEQKSDKEEKNEEEDTSSEPSPSKEKDQAANGEQNSGIQLSEQDKKELENYVENLKKQEQQNQKFFNKQSGNEQDQIFNPFQGDPFFDDVFDRGGEKDW